MTCRHLLDVHRRGIVIELPGETTVAHCPQTARLAGARLSHKCLRETPLGRHIAFAGALSLLACWGVTSWARNYPTNNPMQLQYDHITISVADLAKEMTWYERVFGLRENLFHPGTTIEVAHLSMGGRYHLDLVWQKGSVRPQETGNLKQGWVRAAFTSPAIEVAYERLKTLHVYLHASYDGRGRISRIALRDPEGNEIDIVRRMGATPGELNPTSPIPEAALPAGRARSLVVFTCTVCHSVETFTVRRRTKVDWERTIGRMIALGAVANQYEQGQILNYLAKNLGPLPPPVSVHHAP